MKTLKGTKTAQNLLKAFAGESQARNRYTFYSSSAKKEGYIQIANIFLETAEQEKEHAKVFFKYLAEEFKGEALEIEAGYPIGLSTSTVDNLKHAADGEHEEWDVLYPEFAKIAEEEGFPQIASSFKNIAKVEVLHEKRYLKLLENVKHGHVFEKNEATEWKCSNCGFVHTGKNAPGVCPACKHEQKYFEVNAENY